VNRITVLLKAVWLTLLQRTDSLTTGNRLRVMSPILLIALALCSYEYHFNIFQFLVSDKGLLVGDLYSLNAGAHLFSSPCCPDRLKNLPSQIVTGGKIAGA
jgi:hypothetical protein